MTENSSVYALVGTLLPNQKDPPSGGKISKLVKLFRNFTQFLRHVVTRSWSKFHLQTSLHCAPVVTLLNGSGRALP